MPIGALHLRPCAADDLGSLYAIHREGMRAYVEAAFGSWDDDVQHTAFAAKYADALVTRAYSLSVVEVGGALAGYLHLEPREDSMWLANIRIAADFRRQGIGSALIRRVIADAAPLGVELRVLQVNPARQLYERLGFRAVEATITHVRMRRDGTG
jgi:GNAT superfamily N-acetyltransferase